MEEDEDEKKEEMMQCVLFFVVIQKRRGSWWAVCVFVGGQRKGFAFRNDREESRKGLMTDTLTLAEGKWFYDNIHELGVVPNVGDKVRQIEWIYALEVFWFCF